MTTYREGLARLRLVPIIHRPECGRNVRDDVQCYRPVLEACGGESWIGIHCLA
jgi:hypothetical protein